MGHMDAETHTVRLYAKDGAEVYEKCTEVLANDRQLCFTDSTGKRHEVFGMTYQITEE